MCGLLDENEDVLDCPDNGLDEAEGTGSCLFNEDDIDEPDS